MLDKIVILIAAFVLTTSAFAGSERISTPTTSVTTTGLTATQFIETPLPKENCTTWVRLNTGNSVIPEVLLIHVNRREFGMEPYVKVVSTIKNEKVFIDEVWKIQRWWDMRHDIETLDGGDDIYTILDFSGDQMGYLGYLGGTVEDYFEAQFNSVFALHYRNNATFEQHCSDVPKWIVEAYPYKDRINK